MYRLIRNICLLMIAGFYTAFLNQKFTFYSLIMATYALAYATLLYTRFKPAPAIFYLIPLALYNKYTAIFSIILAALTYLEEKPSYIEELQDTFFLLTLISIFNKYVVESLFFAIIVVLAIHYFESIEKKQKNKAIKIFLFAFVVYFIQYYLSTISQIYYNINVPSTIFFGAMSIQNLMK